MPQRMTQDQDTSRGAHALRLAIDGRPNILQGMCDAVQALRMSNEQIATGLKLLAEATDELLLGLRIKIDHDVSAQDQRKRTDVREGLHQVRALELNEPANVRLDATKALGFAAATQ